MDSILITSEATSLLSAGMETIAVAIFLLTLFTVLHRQARSYADHLRSLASAIRRGWTTNRALEKLTVISKDSVPVMGCPSVSFAVTVFSSRKQSAPAVHRVKVNPFLREYREAVLVCQLSQTHVLLFNKYPIVPHHVLIITDEYEPQDSALTEGDFRGALEVMTALDGVAFFNSGPNAGSSQGHKHVQVIPVDTYPAGRVPLNDMLLLHCGRSKGWTALPEFRFKHIFYLFPEGGSSGTTECGMSEWAKETTEIYREALIRLGNEDMRIDYNVVLTRDWLFMVLRRTETALESIRVNAVGFTGSFVVRSQEDCELLRSAGPLRVLEAVAVLIHEENKLGE